MSEIAAILEPPKTELSSVVGEKVKEKPHVPLRTDLSQEGRAKILALRDERRVGKDHRKLKYQLIDAAEKIA